MARSPDDQLTDDEIEDKVIKQLEKYINQRKVSKMTKNTPRLERVDFVQLLLHGVNALQAIDVGKEYRDT